MAGTFVDRTNNQRQRVIVSWEENASEVIEFDAVVIENHRGSAEVTDHPVENGVDFTDHIRRLQDELIISGVVTDTPVVVDAANNATAPNTGGDPKERAVGAYRFLQQTKDQAKLVQIMTKLREYRNMAITVLNVTRDAETSRIIQADISFREIIIAVTEQVEAPIPSPVTAAPARNQKRPQGKRTKQEETEANKEDTRSLSAQLFDAARGG